MLKKVLQITIVLFLIGNSSFAQVWGGSTTTTGDTYRDGNVGIGTNAPAAKLDVNIFNPTSTSAQYGLLLRTNTFFTWPNAENSYFLKTSDPGNAEATFIINGKGYVGIGTTTPTAPLTVSTGGPIISLFKHTGTANSAITVANNTGQVNLGIGATTPHPYVWSNTGKFFIGDDGNPTMFIGMGNGSVGIGTVNTGSFKLAVEGKIGAREIRVTNANPWPDYVFGDQYKLKSLATLEDYIKQYNHLPNMPSAQEVKDNGIELGNMNARVVEKIEELTLYVIALNKKIETLEKENASLQNQLKK